MKDSEKAALQNELKYYSGLLAAHYSSQHTNVQRGITRKPANSTNSTFKTTNNVNLYKSTSFQPRNVTNIPDSKNKTPSSFHYDIDSRNKFKVFNSLNLKKYPSKSSMVKINPSSLSYKSSNSIKRTIEQDNLLKKNVPDNKNQIVPDVTNKTCGSNPQNIMVELGVLIKQLKKRSQHIDSKINNAFSNVHSIKKCVPVESEVKRTIRTPTDSEILGDTSNKINQIVDMENKNCHTSSSVNSLPPLTRNASCDGEKDISQRKSSDMSSSMVKPLKKLENNFLLLPKHEIVDIANKPSRETSHPVLQVNAIKTPILKKLVHKRHSSGKKINGTNTFTSKYKVVNRKLPFVEQGKKFSLISPEVKTPIKTKPVKKPISSAKKFKSGARLITTKYKIINKKIPCVLSNSRNSFQEKHGDNASQFSTNHKLASTKSNGIKIKVNKLNSKYKIVNKDEKLVNVAPNFVKKNIITEISKLGNFQESRNVNKFSTNNFSRKNIYTLSKLHGERKNIKSAALLKQNHSFTLKRKKDNPSLNSFMSNSKYRTVNKQHSTCLKKSSGIAKANDQNTSMDLDLLMELAAEKKESKDNLVTNNPSKHILIRRVYKSKNAIVNKNVSSLQTKAAKMIKTKYSILNKRHSWQKQNFIKKLNSPKSFKGHKFNSNYHRKIPFFHSERNKRFNSKHHSSYFVGRNYSRSYHMSKNKGSFRSVIKTPRKFVLNRKVGLKAPNTMKSNFPISQTIASRALNRSIYRVLNASVKKTSKVNTYCMFYNRFGRCNNGIKCRYVHDPSKIAVCTRFLRGTCKTENCPFSHEICPGKMAICSFFLLGSCTKTDCPYRHESLSPNAKLCKAFVEGYCPNGKQCEQAHVLICPKFVQGLCNKGKECPFPHPPSKEKKIIPNSFEKNENGKDTGELMLEKVSRYFECGNEPETNVDSSVNIVVRRIRNLPEQPSFIAL